MNAQKIRKHSVKILFSYLDPAIATTMIKLAIVTQGILTCNTNKIVLDSNYSVLNTSIVSLLEVLLLENLKIFDGLILHSIFT